jgi:mono/diheme cytochrome c family protein
MRVGAKEDSLDDASVRSPQGAQSRPRARWSTSWFRLIGAAGIALAAACLYVLVLLNDDRPVSFADVQDHFKYGSTGGERGWRTNLGFGIPYWIWTALPELFPQYLPDRQPGHGFQSFGMIYEKGRDPRFDLPIGMSMRRVQGIDRVYFTCSVCHTGSVRERSEAAPHIVLGMPANTVNFGAIGEFLRRVARDPRFSASRMMPQIESLAALRRRDYRGDAPYRPKEFGVLDTWIFKAFGVAMMRDQLQMLMGRLSFIDFTSWGPGRVDTFDPPKSLLGFRLDNAPAEQMVGIADFPSVWNQKARKGMLLHWDGNNCSVDERNLSAAFGTGATPPTLDRVGVLRIADYLWDVAKPPPFPPAHIDAALAREGEPIYQQYCWTCHGTRTTPFRKPGDGSLVGTVTPIEEVRTDPSRLLSYTHELAQAQGTLYAGYPADEEACRAYEESVCRADQDDKEYRALRDRCYPSRFSHFRKTSGYANAPLDGLWLRAPYLHNGSVPSLRALLEPADQRPAVFYIGYDVYDFDNVGFVTTGADAERHGWRLDTRAKGNGNGGHDGPAYGTLLTRRQKDALIEYLKTF